jgi:hypothetical protein
MSSLYDADQVNLHQLKGIKKVCLISMARSSSLEQTTGSFIQLTAGPKLRGQRQHTGALNPVWDLAKDIVHESSGQSYFAPTEYPIVEGPASGESASTYHHYYLFRRPQRQVSASA